MTTQDTENQAGSHEVGQETVVGAGVEVISGNDAGAAAAAPEGPKEGETGAAAAGSESPTAAPDQSTVAAGEPQADAPPTNRDQLHADAVAFIIAARRLGVDAVEFMKAKVEEIAD